jgi:hypothetical protein
LRKKLSQPPRYRSSTASRKPNNKDRVPHGGPQTSTAGRPLAAQNKRAMLQWHERHQHPHALRPPNPKPQHDTCCTYIRDQMSHGFLQAEGKRICTAKEECTLTIRPGGFLFMSTHDQWMYGNMDKDYFYDDTRLFSREDLGQNGVFWP